MTFRLPTPSDAIPIHVNDDDIALGNANDCIACPVANAIRRAVPIRTAIPIRVFSRYAIIDGTQYVMPKVAQKFIKDFDAGRPVKPFSFDLS